MTDRSPVVAILSGGAPNSPLVAGALAAVYDLGKTFDTIYASGAGGLVGMVFLAPNGQTPSAALQSMLNVAVDDSIYQFFPVGYKTFHKNSPFTKTFIKAGLALHLTNPLFPASLQRFYNDAIDFWFTAFCPSATTVFSQGLCLPFPFVAELVDFTLLRSPSMDGRFFMNAYCIEDAAVQNFSNSQMCEEFFHAALAFPFIYEPVCINGKHFFEGSSIDPINFQILEKLMTIWNADDPTRQGINPSATVVLMDVLGAFESALVRLPRNLFDAYGISIITPICSLARKNKDIFESRRGDITLKCVDFKVTEEQKPFMLDWSYSNMTAMWNVGYEAGRTLVAELGDILPDAGRYPASHPQPSAGK